MTLELEARLLVASFESWYFWSSACDLALSRNHNSLHTSHATGAWWCLQRGRGSGGNTSRARQGSVFTARSYLGTSGPANIPCPYHLPCSWFQVRILSRFERIRLTPPPNTFHTPPKPERKHLWSLFIYGKPSKCQWQQLKQQQLK